MNGLKCMQDLQKRPENKLCNAALVNGFGFESYMRPSKQKMFLCPKIEETCCSIFDQFNIFEFWNHDVKPKLVSYYDGIFQTYKNLQAIYEEANKLDINKMIAISTIDSEAKGNAINSLEAFQKMNFDNILQDAMYYFHENYINLF